ncbi:hypothetical protein, partial [Salmonella enterica]|uniref:hypothetical protein n=1 Tax=Salmonella enterica TaxID=28901 RepID=UPI001C3F405D
MSNIDKLNDPSLIHISESTRLLSNSYAASCLKKKTPASNQTDISFFFSPAKLPSLSSTITPLRFLSVCLILLSPVLFHPSS